MKWIIVLLLFSTISARAQEHVKAIVVDVSSANYFQVKDTKGVKRWVRLAGVLCDEPDAREGLAAMQKVLSVTRNRQVMLVLGGTDENGIRMADLYSRGTYLNALLLREGLCHVDPQHPGSGKLERFQTMAMSANTGRWAKPEPVSTSVPVDERGEQGSFGFDKHTFHYTIAGMGFLAILIVISRRRAATIRRQKREKELSEMIRKKNEESDEKLVPVDLTSNVLVVPRRPTGKPSDSVQIPPRPQCEETSSAGTTEGEDPILARLPRADKEMLDELQEEDRREVLALLREQYGVNDNPSSAG